ncbi:MAG: hypothetical protein ACD_79C01304G0002 [uncultured bacterium]|nr:MAG: hypothetical protein ACD_79C01304G0002 [uncultured bacterium]
MKKNISFITQGCRLNQSETGSLKQGFIQNGFIITDSEGIGDIVVINTCTVTEKSETDLRRLINRLVREKPSVKIAIIGCQAEAGKEKLLEFPNVNWVVGNAGKMNLPEILSKENDKPLVEVPTISNESFVSENSSMDKELTRTNLKVQDGCDCFCSYCIVPYVRGRARSRDFTDILKEINHLLTHDYKEIVLTGINVGKYSSSGKNLNDLISTITEINKDFRLRLSSIEPEPILDSIISNMTINKKICRFLHVPLQSGDDSILNLMGRKYSAEAFKDTIMNAYSNIPDVCLGTDVIVGFPGETEESFRKTYDFVSVLPLSYMHVFSYSPRPNTKSFGFENSVDKNTIKERSELLRKLSETKRKKFFEKFKGKILEVLFEEGNNDVWNGLSDNYIRVKVSSKSNLQNKILPVKITSVGNNHVNGDLVFE